MRTALFAAIAALALAAPAHARPVTTPTQVAKVLKSMGLFGTWGVDCGAMPSSTEWETIEITDKGVIQSVEGGDDAVSVYYIIAAERLSAREVRMKFLYIPEDGTDAEDDGIPSPDQATTVIYRVERNRQMTWFSAGPDGEALIKDGRFIDGDGDVEGGDGERMSLWYNRCPAGPQTPGTPQ